MHAVMKAKIDSIRKHSLLFKNLSEYEDAIKSIENDEEFIKLYNITVQKYLDEGKDPDKITFNEIIELDFDYFARSYGVKCFIVKNKDRNIEFYDI